MDKYNKTWKDCFFNYKQHKIIFFIRKMNSTEGHHTKHNSQFHEDQHCVLFYFIFYVYLCGLGE